LELTKRFRIVAKQFWAEEPEEYFLKNVTDWLQNLTPVRRQPPTGEISAPILLKCDDLLADAQLKKNFSKVVEELQRSLGSKLVTELIARIDAAGQRLPAAVRDLEAVRHHLHSLTDTACRRAAEARAQRETLQRLVGE